MILIWLFIVLSIAAWATGIWGATHPNIVGRGQDPAGKGMAAGCMGIVFGLLGTVCAVIAGVLTYMWMPNLDAVTKIAGYVPVCVIAAGAIFFWAVAKNSSAQRARETRKQERAEQSVVILCHAEPELSQIFAAFQAQQPARWQQLFQSPEHLRWQYPNFAYRAALTTIHITHEIAKDPELEILLQMIEREPAVGNILLYGPEESAITPILTRLRKTKWPVGTVITTGSDWITAQWLPRALELAGPHPKSES